MAVAQPGAVESELFAEFDDLQRGFVARGGIRRIEQANGQESKLAQGACGVGHRFPPGSGAAVPKNMPCGPPVTSGTPRQTSTSPVLGTGLVLVTVDTFAN